ncbi:hypothetical protein C1646_522469 [Rhizophagus diaphanus]|nr:hypothetical protein C1646_522469 [Rhizophagus diaphanus] [Rhizophagus sp. MUCL 43196]
MYLQNITKYKKIKYLYPCSILENSRTNFSMRKCISLCNTMRLIISQLFYQHFFIE